MTLELSRVNFTSKGLHSLHGINNACFTQWWPDQNVKIVRKVSVNSKASQTGGWNPHSGEGSFLSSVGLDSGSRVIIPLGRLPKENGCLVSPSDTCGNIVLPKEEKRKAGWWLQRPSVEGLWGGVQCFQPSGGGMPVEAQGSTPWLRLRVCLIPEGQGTTGPRAGLEYSYGHQWRESAAWLEWTELTGAAETPAGGLKGPAHVGLRP